jgi:hypothetical protein
LGEKRAVLQLDEGRIWTVFANRDGRIKTGGRAARRGKSKPIGDISNEAREWPGDKSKKATNVEVGELRVR